MILVGNKCDLQDERRVSYLEGADLAAECEVLFTEVSAKFGVNVHEMIERMGEQSHLMREGKEKGRR